MNEAGKKPTAFISYSNKDKEWKDRLRPHLKMLKQIGRIVVWNGNIISEGALY